MDILLRNCVPHRSLFTASALLRRGAIRHDRSARSAPSSPGGAEVSAQLVERGRLVACGSFATMVFTCVTIPGYSRLTCFGWCSQLFSILLTVGQGRTSEVKFGLTTTQLPFCDMVGSDLQPEGEASEAARLHHPAWRRGDVADLGTRAAAGEGADERGR